MKLSWKSEMAMWLVVAGMFALAAVTWQGAPDRIPVHWNLQQQVDRYGGRFEGLFGIPLLTLGLYVLMLIVPCIDPGRANYPAFLGAFTTLRLALVVFMAAIYAVIHLWIRGFEVSMNTVMPLLLGALFIGGGLVFMAAGVVRAPWALWIAVLTFATGMVGVVVYSYFVWRADPDKVPPAGTTPA